jgi:hypothetical protein
MPAQNRNALARVIASFAAAAAMAAPAIGIAAVSTYSPHCSNCHSTLTNGTGYPGGAIRASKNPTFLKQKLLAGMGSPTNDILTDTDIVNITNNMATLGVTAAPSISTAATLPGGTYNSFYSTTIAATGAPTPASNPGMGLAAGSPAATFPATPAAFRLTGGSLPPGMSLNGSTGVISGTPTTAGAYSPQITVSNMILPNAVRTFSLTNAKINQTVTFSSAPLVTPT